MKEIQITLNKASRILKSLKDKTVYGAYQNATTVSYSVSAVSGMSPYSIQSKLKEDIKKVTEDSFAITEAIAFFAQIKSAIIRANVETGLSDILCQIDMRKNLKKYYEHYLTTLKQTYAQPPLRCSEDTLNSDMGFNAMISQIVSEITRVDSKNSHINIIIDMETINVDSLEKAIVQLSKEISAYEDEKYRINNTAKITLEVPDSVASFLGL